MSVIEPYQPTKSCPKCWGEDVSTLWLPARTQRRGWEAESCSNEEHMQRTCLRCRYTWAELPMDLLNELQQLGSVKEE
jgi:hypothetical protein